MKELTESTWAKIIECIVDCETIDMISFCSSAEVSVSDFLRWQRTDEKFAADVAYAYAQKMQQLEQRKKYQTLRLHEKIISLVESRLEDKKYTETQSIFKEVKTKDKDGKDVYAPRLVAKRTTEKTRYASDKLLEQGLATVLPEVFHKDTIKPKGFTPPSLFELPETDKEYDLSKLTETETQQFYELLKKIQSK